MILKQFFYKEPNSNIFINQEFTYKNDTFKITKVIKVWGVSPCFLAYAIGINNKNMENKFLLKCISNIYSHKEEDRWKMIISTNDKI